jgi:hypothetical protein
MAVKALSMSYRSAAHKGDTLPATAKTVRISCEIDEDSIVVGHWDWAGNVRGHRRGRDLGELGRGHLRRGRL